MIRAVVLARVVNRLGGFSMGFLGLRLARDLGAELGLVGWVLTVFGVCTIPSRLLGGVLANRICARSAMLIGLLACAAAQLVIAAGRSVLVVVVGAVALGLAYEIIEPATQAAVAQASPPDRRASSYSLLWAALAVAGVIAGVFAAALTRWGVAALFVADGVTSLAAAAVIAALVPAGRAQLRHGRWRSGYWRSGQWRSGVSVRLLAWTAVGCLYATLVMVVVFMLPIAVNLTGRSASLTGWLLATSAAAAVVAQRLLAWWETRQAPDTTLVTGYVVLSVGLVLWAWGTLPALVAGAALEGASGALLLGTQQAIASRMAPPGATATVMTIYGLSWGIGTIAAPTLGTSLLTHGPRVLWLTSSAVAAALGAGHALRRRAR